MKLLIEWIQESKKNAIIAAFLLSVLVAGGITTVNYFQEEARQAEKLEQEKKAYEQLQKEAQDLEDWAKKQRDEQEKKSNLNVRQQKYREENHPKQ